ncbi:predicted protein [Nematostella vectensis]|uniref:DUF885 domain-containing protein n=2 Tax=Nematostella vectensis TaxID=45351 RepID=A7RY40_NEMVE|nr:predicted protein [Nematostella vectensis]|eukprot:XP_001635693.1 predicted protein [Nematostella vectensis]
MSVEETEFDSFNNNSSSRKMVLSEVRITKGKSWRAARVALVVAAILAITGIVCIALGAVRLDRAKGMSTGGQPVGVVCESSRRNLTEGGASGREDPCGPSEELAKSGLLRFLAKVEENYYIHHPFEVPYKYGISRVEVKRTFSPFNPSPEAIQATTDKAQALLRELDSITVDKRLLKPREEMVLAKTRHFLEHNFGSAYDNSYYTGEWMLGPSRFCYMQSFSELQWTFRALMFRIRPRSMDDMEYIIDMMREYGKGIDQYRKNIKLGVKAGMVNSIEECTVGYDCLARYFPEISPTLTPQDILKESFIGSLLGARILSETKNMSSFYWTKKYKKSLARSLREAAVIHLGVPLVELFRYLSGQHRVHCLPSNASSGLASRPVPFVFYHGQPNRSESTTQRLPSHHPLNGKKAYERILRYFTTTNMTPDAVHQVGWKALRSYYAEAVQTAREYTGIHNDSEAIAEFRVVINSSDMFYNDKPFPANESDARAHRLCSNDVAAAFYCPTRYAALKEWFKSSFSTLSMIQPRLLRMFHWMVGPRKTTPVCPVAMATSFEPSNGAQSYRSSGYTCRFPARYYLPFFLDRMGPKYSEWTVNAHEAMPGHHVQSQGYFENFRDTCKPLLAALSRKQYAYTAYSEGWGLYAENPLIAADADVYQVNKLQKFGMLKWQIWRALRLIVDTGLHHKGMTRQKALQLFSHYAWDDSDVAEKEVTRYQSGPGQATAYMIGQRAIIQMREKATQKLKSKFDLEDFHYYFLSQGPAPLSFVAEQIDKFADCELGHDVPGCGMRLGDNRPRPLMTREEKVQEYLEHELSAPHIHEL